MGLFSRDAKLAIFLKFLNELITQNCQKLPMLEVTLNTANTSRDDGLSITYWFQSYLRFVLCKNHPEAFRLSRIGLQFVVTPAITIFHFRHNCELRFRNLSRALISINQRSSKSWHWPSRPRPRFNLVFCLLYSPLFKKLIHPVRRFVSYRPSIYRINNVFNYWIYPAKNKTSVSTILTFF